MKKGSLCLVMLAAGRECDERYDRLVKTFDSVVDHIDYWILGIQTKNTGFEQRVQDYFSDHRIPGELHHTPFKFNNIEFPAVKTKLLQLAEGKAEYILVLDGEIVEVTDPNFKENLRDQSYLVEWRPLPEDHQLYDGYKWSITKLIRSGLDWKYIGLPEYITLNDSLPNSKKLAGIALKSQ